MELKVGQVVNSKGRGFYGRLIRWRNSLIHDKKHNWAHSAIITKVTKNKIQIHEALVEGFVANSYKRESFENKLRRKYFAVGETKAKLKNVLKYARKYEGRGYGFIDVFHIILFWLLGKKAKFLFTHAKHLICSEAVARILYDASKKKINFQREFKIPYDLIEPMHLWRSKQIRWFKDLRSLESKGG